MRILITMLFLFELLLMTSGCGFGGWTIDKLYIQKIEGTSKVLYKYSASGGLDDNRQGYLLLDSTETFQMDVKNDLPFMQLVEPPSRATIRGISEICDSSCGEYYEKAIAIFTPIKIEYSKRQGFRIENIIYQYKGSSERNKFLHEFQFKGFKETRDSLLFYNLIDLQSMKGRKIDSLALRKTDIYINQTVNHEVTSIFVKDIVINMKNNEIISIQSCILKPQTKIESRAFSDYGIFKEIVK